MRFGNQVDVPSLVRVKPRALERLGLYLRRAKLQRAAVLQSEGLVSPLPGRVEKSLAFHDIHIASWSDVEDNQLESSINMLASLPAGVDVLVGVGGGKALDVAKYVATLARLPFVAVPTSLSNDGFCSPRSSLTIEGERRSLPAAVPYGVVIDSQVCMEAPRRLTLSGVGDLVSKFTAVRDWKIAFHDANEPVDDFAALLSDGSVHAFLSHSKLDADGIRLLATALLMNGTAMAMCGSSRPASGSEHLISHALDQLLPQPRLHGIQVGVAAYFISLLQGENSEKISRLFEVTGFWDYVAEEPLPRDIWLKACKLAPSIKPGYHTILSRRELNEASLGLIIDQDRNLSRVIR